MLAKLLAPPFCIACAAYAGRAGPLCRDCRASMRPLPSGEPFAAFAYEGPAGALVRALKFGGRFALADLMAAQLAAHAPPELLRGTVVPVPVHPAHRRRRGIDHAGALAAAFAARVRLPLADCLIRSGDARPQVGRDRHARMRGPSGAIAVRTHLPAPDAALLVDDVITTGATLSACAGALRAAGTAKVAAIAYARTGAR